MKKYWYIVILTVSLFFLAGCMLNLNDPPTVPSNPYPANGASGVTITPTLKWESSDENGDPLTYDLYFGTDGTNLSVEASSLTTNSYEFTESLDEGITYYWQVIAKDGRGGETSSDVWSFTTMGDVISDLNNLTKDDSLYILKIFIDEGIQGLINDLETYTDTHYYDLKGSDKIFDIIRGLEAYYQDLLVDVYDANSDAIQKLKDMMDSSESLVGNGDLRVQIFGQAKTDIMNALEGTEEPKTLVVDYRDLLNMRMKVWNLLNLDEARVPLQFYFDIVDSIDPDDPLDYFLLEASYQPISEFFDQYDKISREPWETEGFWTDLNSLVTTLTGESTVLTTDDIFKEGVLSIGGLDFAIEKGKFILESFNDLYYFEKEKTSEYGGTDDEAISLYEYPYFGNVKEDFNIKQTEFMDGVMDLEDLISELLKLLPEELSILTVEELKVGDIDLLQGPSWIELFEELNSVLPDGVLKLTTKIQTPGIVIIDISIDLDFEALSDGTLDLMNNNLEMNKAMIGELIEQKIWEILASSNITEEQASAIYNIILSNLTSYDPDTNILTIEIDDSIIAEVVINLEWE